MKRIPPSRRKKLTYEKSFATHSRAKDWDYSKNDLKPDQVYKSSGKKYWFTCSECKHSILKGLDSVVRGEWCNYCSNHKLCDNCDICYKKSFASTDLVHLWNDKNEKKPREVFKTSHKKHWFNCKMCKHEHLAQVANITNGNQNCVFCKGKKVCGSEDCIPCFEKSFASVDRSKSWSYKNYIKPIEVRKNSNKKFWFICSECDHEYYLPLNSITQKGTSCPYCTNKILCNKECNICFQKSFAAHKLAGWWDYNKNKLKPRDVFKSTRKKFWFNCEYCSRSFESSLNNVSSGGTECPYCIWKTESKVKEFLESECIKHIHQYKIEYPYDFYLPDYSLIIEVDGRQHFEQCGNWTPYEETQKRDKEKMKTAFENGIGVLRLYQPHVWEDKYDWKMFIKQVLTDIIENKVYISDWDKYIYDNLTKTAPDL